MRAPERRYPAIDILQLYGFGNSKNWCAWLERCRQRQDVRDLEKVYYGVQAGADDCAKSGSMDDKLAAWTVRILRSIEKTAKTVYREKYPVKLQLVSEGPIDKKLLDNKRKADQEFEAWVRRSTY